jgi:hypothetical protein
MLATTFSNYGKPAEDLMHAIECARDQSVINTLLVRRGGLWPGSDRQFYDVGRFQFATEGMQSASNIGGLWITYDVTLRKPIISPYSIGAPMDGFYIPSILDWTDFGSPAKKYVYSNSVGGVWDYSSTLGTLYYTFPLGSVGNVYEVTQNWFSAIAADTGAGSLYTVTLTGCVPKTLYKNTTSNNMKSNGSSVSNTMCTFDGIQITAQGSEYAEFSINLFNKPVSWVGVQVIVRLSQQNTGSTDVYYAPDLASRERKESKERKVRVTSDLMRPSRAPLSID